MRFMDITELLANNIRLAMDRRGINSQAALAKKSGLSQQMINFVVNGKSSISVTRLASIAKALRLEPWQLLLPPDVFQDNLNGNVSEILPLLLTLTPLQRQSILDIAYSLGVAATENVRIPASHQP